MRLRRDERYFMWDSDLKNFININDLRWDKCLGQIILFVPRGV